MDSDTEQHDSALYHYDEAIKMARNMSRRDVLIEVLLGRGSYYARQGEAEAAYSDLAEALGYATSDSYRIYEVDTRVALAWTYSAAGDATVAHAEAEHARRISTDMSYYWGRIEAEEVLVTL